MENRAKWAMAIVLIAAMAVISVPYQATADRLRDFEENIGGDSSSGKKKKKKHERRDYDHDYHHEYDYDDDDDDCSGFFICLIFFILESMLEDDTENRASPPDGESIQPDTPESEAIIEYRAEVGEESPSRKIPGPEPKGTVLSLGGMYMYVDPELYAGGGWFRLGRTIGFQLNYIEFTEEIGDNEFDVLGIWAMGPYFAYPNGEKFTLRWEMPTFVMVSSLDDNAWGLGLSGEIMIIDPLFFEWRTSVGFFETNPLWDLGGYLKIRRYVGIRVGYRSLIAGDADLSGPEVGLMLEF